MPKTPKTAKGKTIIGTEVQTITGKVVDSNKNTVFVKWSNGEVEPISRTSRSVIFGY